MCWTPGPYSILFLIFPITSKSNYSYPRFTDEKTVIQETISLKITGLVGSFVQVQIYTCLGSASVSDSEQSFPNSLLFFI